MKINDLHDWDLTPTRAAALQRELAGTIDVRSPLKDWSLVAGADISYDIDSPVLHATVVVLRLPDFEPVEARDATMEVSFPYIPGLLSFREIPPLLECFRALDAIPDVVICDGQGTAHPRRFGVACHLGLWLDVPCLGCAKSRLTGEFEEPEQTAGSSSELIAGGEVIGSVLRTADGVNPVFVSPGHRIDLGAARRVVLSVCRGYRLPETTRVADHRANRIRAGEPPDS